MSEPRTAEWIAHGLAAMDELRRLYVEGSVRPPIGQNPGDITVVDWDACESAIRTAFEAIREETVDA